MSKDKVWALSFGLSFLLWVIFPQYRIFFTVILLMHIPVLIWGIIDLRNCFFCKAYFHKAGENKQLALTFDDGPDPNCTPKVLDLLDKYDFHATFFVIAEKAERYPEICQEIVKRGHTIGCHDLNHSFLSNFRFTKQMTREIGTAQQIIKSIIGKTPLLYRPPVGLSNPHLRRALRELNMKCIGWSSSVRDAGNRRIHTFRYFHLMARPGSVILLHDVLPKPGTEELYFMELEKLFIQIQQDNLTSVTVDMLFQEDAYS